MTDEQRIAQRAASKRWRQKNKEYESKRNRLYRLAHLNKLREAGRRNGKRRYAANPELYAQKNREQRQKHLEKRLTADREYYQTHIDQRREFARNRYFRLKDDPIQREKKRKWDRIYQSRRRALKRASAINLQGIKDWMRYILSKKTFVCYHCGERCGISLLHFDHIIPLAKGGPHTIENLCTSCDPCNRSKHDKLIRSWVKIGQQTLEL